MPGKLVVRGRIELPTFRFQFGCGFPVVDRGRTRTCGDSVGLAQARVAAAVRLISRRSSR